MNSASLCSLAGRYDNPIPTWFLAPIDCLKIPALLLSPYTIFVDVDITESNLLKVPKCEIFHLFDFNDFYGITSL